jgi:predicted porin
MKKIIMATLLVTTAVAAHAQVSLFGTMDAGYTNGKAPGANTTKTGFTSGGMTTSNIGVRGSEDLGNGASAVFELSSFLDAGTGATLGGTNPNTFTRSAFVGVSDKKLGGVTLGRQSNPSFLPTILFNAYGDSSAYSPLWHATYFGNTGNPNVLVFNDTGWDNAVAYSTPSIGGATVTAMSSRTLAGGNTGANFLYFGGNLGLTGYYQKTRVNSTGSFLPNIFTAGKPATAKGVGASYDFKAAKVFATWQEGKSDAVGLDGKTMQVSALVPFGRGNVMTEYATTKVGATKYNEWAVGYDLALSKKTDLYVTGGKTAVTGLNDGNNVGAGVRVRF